MKYYISEVLWKSVQAFIFSFVTAPAVALLLVLFCTTLTSSPSRAILDQARSLVGNTTSTTVMVCSDENAEFVAFRSSDCPRHAVNADDAIKQWDSQLLKGYLIVAGIALFCLMVSEAVNYRRKPWRYGIRPADMTFSHTKLVPKESDDDADK
ncbi:hypothetical protein IHW74_004311 [Salmonella enterica]|nr:hypothetical protein [Salmonella enterica]